MRNSLALNERFLPLAQSQEQELDPRTQSREKLKKEKEIEETMKLIGEFEESLERSTTLPRWRLTRVYSDPIPAKPRGMLAQYNKMPVSKRTAFEHPPPSRQKYSFYSRTYPRGFIYKDFQTKKIIHPTEPLDEWEQLTPEEKKSRWGLYTQAFNSE